MQTQKLFPFRWNGWLLFAKLAMTLGLMLFCVSCASNTGRLKPSIGTGNAILTTLPAGTQLQLPTASTAAQLRALFLNEVKPVENEDELLRLSAPLKVCTPEYIQQRDAAEAAALLKMKVGE